MEKKSVEIEVKDFSKQSRTALVAHAVYGNIDSYGDISTKGMFNSSWERKSKIGFYFNHNPSQIPGTVLRTFEDETKAYTEVKFGNWRLGDDMLEMLDAGVIRGASFGYFTEKKDYKNINNRQVRVLRQVRHTETSLLTENPANPLAQVVNYTKSDYLNEIKSRIEELESFCRNTNASDETILAIQTKVAELKALTEYDTASTPLIVDGGASKKESEVLTQLALIKLKM